MFGKIDPRKMEQMMKKLNMNVKNIDAKEVIIKTADGDIIISNPEVMVVDMMGKDVYQISGNVSSGANEEDIKMVMEHTGKSRVDVEKKLEELNNDLARAIIELKEKK